MATYNRMTKAELLQVIKKLEAEKRRRAAVLGASFELAERDRLMHELQVHQVELETQNEELRQTHQLLEESRDRYANLYDASPLGYLTLDAKGTIREINLTGAAMLGVDRKNLTGMPFGAYVAKGEIEKFHMHLGKCKQTTDRITTELMLTPKGHAPIAMQLTSIGFHDVDEQELVLQTTLEDITERKRVEEALQVSESNAHALLNAIFESVLLIESDGVVLDLNEVGAARLGKSPAEIIGKNIYDYLPTDVAAARREKVTQALQSSEPINFEDTRFGRILYQSVYAIPARGDEKRRVAIFAQDITERKQAEQALHLSELDLKNAQAVAHIGNWKWEVKNGEITWSDEMYRIFGIDKNSYTGRLGDVVAKVIHPDDLYLVLPTNAKSFAEEKPIEYRIILPDKSIRYIWAKSGEAIVDNEGQPTFLTGIAQDITESKRADEALRASEKRLDMLISNLPGFVYRCKNDRDWTMEYISGGCYGITGYAPEDFLSKTLAYNDIVYPDYQTPLWDKWQELLSQHKPFEEEYPIRTAGGETRWVWERGRGIFSEDGQLLYLEGFITDITERKRAEEALRQSEEFLNESQGIAKMGSWELDLVNNKSYWSDSCFVLYGLEPHGIVPSFDLFRSWVHPDDLRILDNEFENIVQNKKSSSSEIRITCPDGTIKWLYNNVVPVIVNNNLIGLKGIQIDITARKLAEEKLSASERLLRSFTANVPGIAFVIDRNGFFKLSEGKGLAELGLLPGQVVGMSVDDVYSDAPHIVASIQRALGGEAFSTMGSFNGLVFETNYQPLWNDDIVVGVVGVATNVTERKRAEETLRKSEAQLTNAVQIARLGPWELDVASGMFTFTDSFYAIFHTTAQEMGGYQMSIADYAKRFVHPDDARLVGEETRKALETDDPNFSRYTEHRMLYADGSVGHLAVRFFIVKDEQGNTIKTYGVNQDITERKRAEEKLMESEDKFRTLAALVPVGIYLTDPAGNCLYANHTWCKMAGLSLEEALGQGWVKGLHPDDRDLVFANWQQMVESQGQWSLEYRFMNSQGEIFTVQGLATPQYNDSGRIVRYIGVNVDITARKRTEDELRMAYNRLKLAQHAANAGLWDWDIKTGQLNWSEEFYNLFGLPLTAEASFDTWREVLNPDDVASAEPRIYRAIEEHTPLYNEYRVILPNHQEIWVSALGNTTYDDAGQPLRMSGICIDITTQKKAEARARALAHSAERLNAQLELDDVLNVICEEAARALDVPAAMIILYGAASESFSKLVEYGIPHTGRGCLQSPSYARLVEYVRVHDNEIIIPDIQANPRMGNADLFAEWDARTLVGVTVRHEGCLIGALGVVTFGQVREFSAEEIDLLKSLATQAAIAIEKARLLQAVRAEQARSQELANQVVLASESERAHLSRELHDEAGQFLTALNINLGLIQSKLPPADANLHTHVRDAQALATQTIETIRTLAQNLRPPALDTLGLDASLEGLCAGFVQQTRLQIEYVGATVPPMSEASEICLYRVLQESLNNVAKHAHAQRVQVKLQCTLEKIQLCVQDDGQGFDVHAPRSKGIGLIGMRERLELLGGQLEIKSQPGQGTCVCAQLPLLKEDLAG